MKKKRLTMGKKFILTLSIATVCYQAYAEHYKIRVVYKDTPKTTSTAVSSLYSVVNDSQHGKSAVLTVDPSAELQSKIQECVGDNIYVSNEKYIEQYGVSPEAFCAARIMSDDNSNIKYALPVGVKSRISSHNIISNDSDEYTGINVTQWFRQDWDMGNQVEWSGIDAPGAWAYLTGRSLSTVHIAVIDSGIAVRSAYDFRSRINDLNSYHFYPNFTTGEVVMDDDIYATVEFHGTHVGGTIIANGPNVTGVVGNIPEAQAYALRVLNDDNVGNDASMNFAELWAVNQLKNPMVINQYPYLSTFIDNPLPAKILNQSYGASRYNNAGEPTSSLDFWV
ncbi:MAG: subtilisin family serine protease, partial [Francisellaceae bacterium]